MIPHLPTLAAEGARFLYVGPGLEVPQAEARLAEVGWAVLAEWRGRVRGWLPTWEDYCLRCEFTNTVPDPALWSRKVTERGLAYFEERYTVLAAAK
ncbi:hypothetical protein [Deinococcus altitudinis]|uniref:hypothetical protein n=1 Tax=Deinococcus altitudinis TaxID=468914 RepID=UPI003891D22C